ncbi:ketoacyl-synt-domain-containing protein [Gonapodya prolifera JEL478]|uniref:Ketoacyl-synt-domain-containing protein n=1 Tax=Gonapodya prolifera (strain JEL478) TaxID=1344416 RepID=A0A139ALH5_GONPJ|nr:ketoacyl-synt-domain-containing protein [Gonapodya prolifera JEL478]|eukprot:KXS17636.1 ketoacyl-synt-domain-containing protein [Gonapodya prolifera JEL478]
MKTWDEPIAVVGIACRLPGGAETPDKFWKVLSAGKDIRTGPPNDRWKTKITESAPIRGVYIPDVDKFDPEYFHLSDKEVLDMEAHQRVGIEVCAELMRNCGYWDDAERKAQKGKDDVGLYIGLAHADGTSLGLQNEMSPYSLVGFLPFGTANRISHCLGIKGPSINVDTACSASLTSVHVACEALLLGDCDAAIAAGVNIVTNPSAYTALWNLGVLSPDFCIKAFDAKGNGYMRGEGCGAVMLKRLSDAEKDGDNILCIIRGTGAGHNGLSRNIAAPSIEGQGRVIKDALERGKLTPDDVDYLEAHATGTKSGDRKELQTVQELYIANQKRERPIVLGAVKSMYGHSEGAAGITGLIKAILVLLHREVPPNIHFDEIRPEVKIDVSKIVIPTGSSYSLADRPFPIRAGVNSFGAGGTNAHVLIEEVKVKAPPTFGDYTYNKKYLPMIQQRGSYYKTKQIREWEGSVDDEKPAKPAESVPFALQVTGIALTAAIAGFVLGRVIN